VLQVYLVRRLCFYVCFVGYIEEGANGMVSYMGGRA